MVLDSLGLDPCLCFLFLGDVLKSWFCILPIKEKKSAGSCMESERPRRASASVMLLLLCCVNSEFIMV